MKNNNHFCIVGKTETHFLRRLFFVFCFLLIVMMPVIDACATSYAVYVDSHASGDDEDGSKDKPFKKIKDALEEVKSGENIYIAKGSYDGSFTVPSSVGLYGESKDGVVISGTVSAQNGDSFSNLTISGGNVALSIKPGSSVTLNKCIINNATKIGIDIEPGNGKLTVENSKIQKNGKGIYAQRGNQLRLFGNSIVKNKEEGIDIRSKVDGSIKGNEITGNGESGIEVILGSSDLSISDNNISSNSASGIATQYYDDFSKKGKVKINNNKIKNNNHYGIKCGTPSGGSTPTGYWAKSLNLNGNTFSGNDEGDIAGRCKITLDDETDEGTAAVIAKTEETEATNKTKPDAAEIAEEKEDEEIAAQLAQEEAANIRTQAQAIGKEMELIENDSQQSVVRINNMPRFKYLFSGPDSSIVSGVEAGITDYEQKIAQVSELAVQAPSDELKSELESQVADYQQRLTNQKEILADIKDESSFMYRFNNIFSREWQKLRTLLTFS